MLSQQADLRSIVEEIEVRKSLLMSEDQMFFLSWLNGKSEVLIINLPFLVQNSTKKAKWVFFCKYISEVR